MTFLYIFILSLVQGITEFLPISSSTHLFIASKLFLTQEFLTQEFLTTEFSFSFKVALHVGSLIALIIYFRKVIWNIMLGLFTNKVKLANTAFWMLVLGTLPVIIVGSILHNYIKVFDSNLYSGIMLIVFGILLYLCDKICSNKECNKYVRILQIGLLQSLAIFPGVSRLGICITAGRITGLNRKESISMSMLLAIPSIAGSLVLELIKTDNIKTLINSDAITGIFLTSVMSILALDLCIKYMERNGFKALMWYRIIIGLILMSLVK